MMGDDSLIDTPPKEPLGHMDALPVGTMVGEFELQGLLGVGGFGMVYRGYDHSLHRAVAIKEYMPSALVGRAPDLQVSARSSADTQSYLTGLASFMAEARLLAQFDHPSLVKVYRVWEENNTAYMAMPLYSGMTLKQARQLMSGPPPEDWLRAILWSMLEALKVLHAAGTLHRDVSPDNIFLQDLGPPVLLDLGAARRSVIDSSRKHTAILKVNYAPIEQYADAQDMQEGPWTDLYALAAVIHGCLCNEPPLPANFRVVRDRMPSIAAVVKTVEKHFGQTYSHAFVRAINHGLAIQPDKRTKDAEAFARELRLRTPKYMARFEWRERLGDGVTLDGSKVVGNGETHLRTRPHIAGDPTQALDEPAGAASFGGGGILFQPSKSVQGKWRWLVVGLTFVAVAVAAGTYLYRLSHVEPLPVSPAISLPPAPPAVIDEPAAAAPQPQFAASETMIEETATPNPFTEHEEKSAPAPKSATMHVPKPVVKTPVHPVGTNKPENGIGRTQAASRSGLPSPAGGAVAPIAKSPPAVRELCASSSIFTRPMCIYRECQKPEFANLPVCIEDRKRWSKPEGARSF